MKEPRVLLVEPDPVMRRHLTSVLRECGYEPLVTSSLAEAHAALTHNRFLFSLLDVDLDGADGIDLLRRLKVLASNSGPIIMLSDTNGLEQIADAASLGPDNVIRKSPFRRQHLEDAIKEVLTRPQGAWSQAPTHDSVARLRQETTLWRSSKMEAVWEIIQQTAQVDVTVLVTGETGVGKDLVARAIHYLSSRQSEPYVKVNCAAVPRELLESELFGHERGAFTGAHQLKMGKFESANHGTIFLNEIGDLHPALQAKLLHVLQDGEFSRVGGTAPMKVDVRVIAATNQELEPAVAAGRFREDLYYRLNVIHVVVPPLRERTDEIPLLVKYFTDRYSRLYDRQPFTIPPHVTERLVQHHFPGNVRELENIIKRMIVLNDPLLTRTTLSRVKADDQGFKTQPQTPGRALSLKEIAREAALAAEREAMSKVLEQTRWNRVQAAKLLNISYRALLYKIKLAGLDSARVTVQSGP